MRRTSTSSASSSLAFLATRTSDTIVRDAGSTMSGSTPTRSTRRTGNEGA